MQIKPILPAKLPGLQYPNCKSKELCQRDQIYLLMNHNDNLLVLNQDTVNKGCNLLDDRSNLIIIYLSSL